MGVNRRALAASRVVVDRSPYEKLSGLQREIVVLMDGLAHAYGDTQTGWTASTIARHIKKDIRTRSVSQYLRAMEDQGLIEGQQLMKGEKHWRLRPSSYYAVTVPHIFSNGNRLGSASQHQNGGGWVESTASVDEDAYVGPFATVSGNAVVGVGATIAGEAGVGYSSSVRGYAVIKDKAQISGDARVSGAAHVSGNAVVSCDAEVRDDARIRDDAQATDSASVGDHAMICGQAIVQDEGTVCASAVVQDAALVCGQGTVTGKAVVKEDAVVGDCATVSGSAVICAGAVVAGELRIDKGVITSETNWAPGESSEEMQRQLQNLEPLSF